MAQDEKRDLRVFMREAAKTEDIVTVPGPSTILGEDGEPVMLEIKVLRSERLQQINDNYTKKTMAVDNRGKPYIANGEVAFRVERDSKRAAQHIMAEALVYPDLKDPELMAFFGCKDITQMPMKVFPRTDEYKHVSDAIMAALSLSSEPAKEDQEEELEDAKN